MMAIWLPPLLGLIAALIAVFEKTYTVSNAGRFKLTKFGLAAISIAAITTCLSIYLNYDRRSSNIVQENKIENISSDLVQAQDSRNTLLDQLTRARFERDDLRTKLDQSNALASLNKNNLNESVQETKKLVLLLDRAKEDIKIASNRIKELNTNLLFTKNQLENVLSLLDRADKKNTSLVSEILKIGSAIKILGSNVYGDPGSVVELREVNGNGIIKTTSENCNYLFLIEYEDDSIPVGNGLHAPKVPVLLDFQNLKSLKVSFGRNTGVEKCDLSYSFSKSGS